MVVLHRFYCIHGVKIKFFLYMYVFGSTRVFLFCISVCHTTGPLGMITGDIKDWQISASSAYPNEWDNKCREKYARVFLENKYGWCAKYKSASEWLQVDLGVSSRVSFESFITVVYAVFVECIWHAISKTAYKMAAILVMWDRSLIYCPTLYTWVKVFRINPESRILRLTFYRKSASRC